jgi:5-methylcytosine-specific restriction enzyme A
MKTSNQLQIGRSYTLKELAKKFGLQKIESGTGIFRPPGYESVWFFVWGGWNKDDYEWEKRVGGAPLIWHPWPKTEEDRWVLQARCNGDEILLFSKWATGYPSSAKVRYIGKLTYHPGRGKQEGHLILKSPLVRRTAKQTVLSGVLCSRALKRSVEKDIESQELENRFMEGGKSAHYTNHYERDPKLKMAVIAAHGLQCKACGVDFEAVYGPHGKGYIEAHHLKPVSSVKERTRIDPRRAMTVLCANCHRMVHRRADAVLSVEALRKMLRRHMQPKSIPCGVVAG